MEVGACSKEEMLRLAQMFLLPDLAEHLGGQLARRLTVENFTRMALLADSHTCQALMRVRSCLYPFVINANCVSDIGVQQLSPVPLRRDHLVGTVGGAQRGEARAGDRAAGGEGGEEVAEEEAGALGTGFRVFGIHLAVADRDICLRSSIFSVGVTYKYARVFSPCHLLWILHESCGLLHPLPGE